MKKTKLTKKLSALILTASLILTALPVSVSAVPTIPRETSRTTEEIKLSDGTKTGVMYTRIYFTNKTGGKRLANIAECDLANTHLSIETINGGNALVNTQTTTSMASAFSNTDRTVLCAVNGDLWMTGATSTSSITKKTLQTSRGIFIIDREIWATQEIAMETGVDNPDPGSNQKASFGVTDKNQPLVGVPVITVSMKNETRNTTVSANGINRLPANNAIIVYNSRCYSTNYALNDSYEIELETSSSSFILGGKVTGKVKAIYASGSTTRPSIGKNTVVITARGNRISDVEGYKVGDTVSLTTAIYDKKGNTTLWNNVVDAIGGHIQELNDGYEFQVSAENKEYPMSLIGIKDNGNVMLCTVSGQTAGQYVGLNFNQTLDFLRDVGYRSVFLLDGGGSATFTVLKDGTYTVRNKPSDSGGVQRGVINAVAIVWNKNPVCEKQGSIDYIKQMPDLSGITPQYMDGSLLWQILRQPSDTELFLSSDNTLKMKIVPNATDPNALIDFTYFDRINLEDYPFLMMRARSTAPGDCHFGFFFATEDSPVLDGNKYVGMTVKGVDNGWQDITLDLRSSASWKGKLKALRLDPFNNVASPPEASIEIEYIAFAPTSTGSIKITRGIYPENTIINYSAYKVCAGNHTYTDYAGKLISDESHTVTCNVCGFVQTLPHVMVTVPTTPATCLSDGIGEYRCKYCKLVSETVTIPKGAHSFVRTEAVPATCTATGMTEGVYCSVCNLTVLEAKTVPMIPHNFVNGFCTLCGESDVRKGDLDGNGEITAIDANLYKKILAGTLIPTEKQMRAGDINGDTEVTSIDANLIQKYISGTISGF